jgi:hypothetical protein
MGVACALWFGHALPHAPQLLGSVIVSTHAPLGHLVGAFGEHPDMQENDRPEPEQFGVGPLHVTPQAPQLLVESIAVSHPWSGPPLQCA